MIQEVTFTVVELGNWYIWRIVVWWQNYAPNGRLGGLDGVDVHV